MSKDNKNVKKPEIQKPQFNNGINSLHLILMNPYKDIKDIYDKCFMVIHNLRGLFGVNHPKYKEWVDKFSQITKICNDLTEYKEILYFNK